MAMPGMTNAVRVVIAVDRYKFFATPLPVDADRVQPHGSSGSRCEKTVWCGSSAQ